MMEMYDELIIAEKPSSARKIAQALAESKIITKRHGKVPYFEIERKGKKIAVVGAAGHLFGLAEREKVAYNHYPVFDVEWKPLYVVGKSATYTKEYISAIKMLSNKSKKIIVATDYDIEGETIGFNILRFICNRKNAQRMLFSTLTKDDLVKAYENAKPTILFGLAEAGVTRHILDYFWGINVSRALMSAVKKAGRHFILSSGRVQGPALKIVYDRELEIRQFMPTPYWKLSIEVMGVKAEYEGGKIEKEVVARDLHRKVKATKHARVAEINRKKKKHNPPASFNLNDLQAEAYALFKLSPKQTQDIAQKLYEMSLISYPRTSSQKLPRTIDFHKILHGISKISQYQSVVAELLSKRLLIPKEGKKDDEAHPAIHPTGEVPQNLGKNEAKIYDLIVRRFLACFMEPAEKMLTKVVFDANGAKFIATGVQVVHEGWYRAYKPYLRSKEIELPAFTLNGTYPVDKVKLEKKMTTPPDRYTAASLVRELEKRNLGTKATRAEIVHHLYERKYIKGNKIEITPIGEKVVTILKEYAERIMDEELTREFEEKLEKISKGIAKSDEIVVEAKNHLISVLNKLKEKEEELGKELVYSIKDMESKERVLGKCKCGGNLIIRKGKSGKRFVSCDTYPKCKISYPLPTKGQIIPTGRVCETCGTPIIRVIMRTKGKKSSHWFICLDPSCKKRSKKKLRL